MSSTELIEKLPYFVFPGGIAVCKEIHNDEGDWYPPGILPLKARDRPSPEKRNGKRREGKLSRTSNRH